MSMKSVAWCSGCNGTLWSGLSLNRWQFFLPAFVIEQETLGFDPPTIATEFSVCPDDSVAGNEVSQRIRAASVCNGSRRTGLPDSVS